MKKKSKRMWIITGCLIPIVAIAVIFMNNNGSATGAAAEQNAQIAVVERGDTQVVKEGNGTVEVKDSYQVSIIYDSKLLFIEKENGDYVNEGEVIASIESSGLEDSISQLESEISDLDTQISNKDSYGDSYISSKVTGRVKVINAGAGDAVNSVMKEYGSLMEIASDGKLKVMVSAETVLAENSEVTVKFGDYSEEGTVISSENNQLTVTISDGYDYNVGEKASVYDSEDKLLGEGTLEINMPYHVTGDYGTIDSISIDLNDKVYDGSTLLYLENVKNYPGYTDLIDKRNLKIEELWDLKEYRRTQAITAPVSGIISNMTATAGMTVLKDSEFCDILDNSIYQLKAEIDELDIDGVKEGQTAKVVFDAFEDEEYEGVVSKVSNIGNNTNGVTTYTVFIELEGTDRIKSNMSATAKIVTATSEQTLLVPIDAIQTVDGKKMVSVVTGSGKNQTSEMKEVTLGLVNNTQAEVIAGLEEGQTVTVISTKTTDTDIGTQMDSLRNANQGNQAQAETN